MLSRNLFFDLILKKSIHRRPPKISRKTSADILLWKTIENHSIKSPEDWKTIRNEVLATSDPRNQITNVTIDAMTIGVCTSMKRYDLAWGYMDYLSKENIKPNLATLGKVLKLLYVKGSTEELTVEDEQRIMEISADVRKSYPVLDSLTLDSVILALSLTQNWKESLNLLEEYKTLAHLSIAAYNSVVSAAFAHREDDTAWTLLREMLGEEKIPDSRVFVTFLRTLKNGDEITRGIEQLLSFIQKYDLKVDEDLAKALVGTCKDNGYLERPTTVTKGGVCKVCKNKLKKFELSETEFEDLKKKVMANVIIGRDVFNQTTPQELNRLKVFISNMEKFDVVVDGLNVAYSSGVQKPPSITSGLVVSVVAYFVSQKKKVLVLGRNHMNKWPKQNLSYLNQNATVFLTENLSEDDPYLLYCGLNCGKDTIIVSRDLMRGHKVRLANPRLKQLFERWLTQQRYQLIRARVGLDPIFQIPPPFSYVPQKNGECWHVPFRIQNSEDISWLCLKL